MLYYWRQRAKKELMSTLSIHACRFEQNISITGWKAFCICRIHLDCQQCQLSTVSIHPWVGVHPVLMLYYWRQRAKKGLMSTLSTNIALNALRALIFVSTVSANKIPTQYTIALLWSFVSTLSTNIALNALRALIFVSTVSTNKIPYSIHNSIVLIFCIDHLDMPSCPFELQCRF